MNRKLSNTRKLEDKDLAKKIWKQQVFNDWPGLAREVSVICNELGIDDANVVNCTRIEWKRKVNKACEEKSKNDLMK